MHIIIYYDTITSGSKSDVLQKKLNIYICKWLCDIFSNYFFTRTNSGWSKWVRWRALILLCPFVWYSWQEIRHHLDTRRGSKTGLTKNDFKFCFWNLQCLIIQLSELKCIYFMRLLLKKNTRALWLTGKCRQHYNVDKRHANTYFSNIIKHCITR